MKTKERIKEIEKEITELETIEDKSVKNEDWFGFFDKIGTIPKKDMNKIQKTIYNTILKAELKGFKEARALKDADYKELYKELHKSIDEMRRQRNEVIEQLSSLQKQFEHLYDLREEETKVLKDKIIEKLDIIIEQKNQIEQRDAEMLEKVEKITFTMLQSRDCFGFNPHKVFTTNLIYKYQIEPTKTKEDKRLLDFAMGCYRNGWLEAIYQFDELIKEELKQKIQGDEK